MTDNEQIAIIKLNDIQIKISTAVRWLLAGQMGSAMTPLIFARNDLERLVGFLGDSPNKDELKKQIDEVEK